MGTPTVETVGFLSLLPFSNSSLVLCCCNRTLGRKSRTCWSTHPIEPKAEDLKQAESSAVNSRRQGCET
jgi:hypothetical protein